MTEKSFAEITMEQQDEIAALRVQLEAAHRMAAAGQTLADCLSDEEKGPDEVFADWGDAWTAFKEAAKAGAEVLAEMEGGQ